MVEHVTAEQPLLLVHPRHNPQHHLEEAHRLATSLYGTSTVIHTLPVGSSRRNRPSPSTYFGRGAVDAIARACRDNIHPRAVIVNAHLSGVQQRNLEAAVGRAVMDRVALIIDIFAQRARTKEAKLQVQLAQLEYAGSRLVRIVDAATGRRRGFGIGGEVEVVSARERGRSGSGSGGLGGAGGGGESELELQGRRLAARRVRLRQELEEVRRTREVQRAGRRRTGMPSIALVGYTNVGKTSLLRALSKKHDIAAAEDK